MPPDFADGMIDLVGAAVENQIVMTSWKKQSTQCLGHVDAFVHAACSMIAVGEGSNSIMGTRAR